jgi:hypothetical protein
LKISSGKMSQIYKDASKILREITAKRTSLRACIGKSMKIIGDKRTKIAYAILNKLLPHKLALANHISKIWPS